MQLYYRHTDMQYPHKQPRIHHEFEFQKTWETRMQDISTMCTSCGYHQLRRIRCLWFELHTLPDVFPTTRRPTCFRRPLSQLPRSRSPIPRLRSPLNNCLRRGLAVHAGDDGERVVCRSLCWKPSPSPSVLRRAIASIPGRSDRNKC